MKKAGKTAKGKEAPITRGKRATNPPYKAKSYK